MERNIERVRWIAQRVEEYTNEDILDGMNKAELLLEGIRYSEFKADFRINFAVVRALEIIGEATKRRSPTCGRSLPIHSRGLSEARPPSVSSRAST